MAGQFISPNLITIKELSINYMRPITISMQNSSKTLNMNSLPLLKLNGMIIVSISILPILSLMFISRLN